MIAIGNYIGRKKSGGTNWNAWINANVFDFLWVEGNNTATQLLDISGNGNHVTITGKDFSTNYIPATSSATFKTPNNATFIADDNDLLWITGLNVSREVTVAELIGYDFTRTLVKYDNAAPHHIRAIAIFKSTVTITQAIKDLASKDFSLYMFFFGSQNDNGFAKENRPGATWIMPPRIIFDGNTVGYYEYQTLTKDGSDRVSSWTDQSGAGNHLLQGTDDLKPTAGANGVLFDGSNDYIKATFDWDQPEFVYMVVKQVGWTRYDRIFDGGINDSMRLWQENVTPKIQASAGSVSDMSSDLAVGDWGIIRVLYYGANSKLIVDGHDAITGDFGAANADGFTLGARAGASQYGNIQVKEIVLRKTSDNSTVEGLIYNYLKNKYSL